MATYVYESLDQPGKFFEVQQKMSDSPIQQYLEETYQDDPGNQSVIISKVLHRVRRVPQLPAVHFRGGGWTSRGN